MYGSAALEEKQKEVVDAHTEAEMGWQPDLDKKNVNFNPWATGAQGMAAPAQNPAAAGPAANAPPTDFVTTTVQKEVFRQEYGPSGGRAPV